MKIKTFLRLTSTVIIVIGFTLVIFPGFIENFFVSNSSHGGDIFIRFLGSSLVGYSYLNWFTSGLDNIKTMRATIIGNFSTLLLAFLISVLALANGTLNREGILIVLLHLVFSLGFGYYLFKVKDEIKIPKAKDK